MAIHNEYKNLFKVKIYNLKKKFKKKFFNNFINKLSMHHYKNCVQYRQILNNLNFNINKKNYELKDYPTIPVSLFKFLDLYSVNKKKIVKKILSSGTTNKNLSKINLDKLNSNNQVKALNNILKNLLGTRRLPMLIVEKDPRNDHKINFNAKVAAILGFSLFGKDHCYILDKEGKLDFNLLKKFYNKFSNEKFFIFGFTSSIFKHLIKNPSFKKNKYNLKNGILLHGGGWKKLEEIKVNNNRFKELLIKKFNLRSVFNYYGMVEQTGSIFIEGKNCGYLHTSIYSDILIRDKDFNLLEKNKKGIVQLFSILPSSYPGHNILTEDIGELKGEDDCKCGLKGKYFLIHGRIKEAEIRGCSDVR